MQKNESPQDDIEEDTLEAQERNTRETDPETSDPDEIETYDSDMKTNHYESKGSYSIDLVGQQRMLRNARSAEDYLEHSDMMESSMLAFINHSQLIIEAKASHLLPVKEAYV